MLRYFLPKQFQEQFNKKYNKNIRFLWLLFGVYTSLTGVFSTQNVVQWYSGVNFFPWRFTFDIWHLTFDIWHLTFDVWRLTFDWQYWYLLYRLYGTHSYLPSRSTWWPRPHGALVVTVFKPFFLEFEATEK